MDSVSAVSQVKSEDQTNEQKEELVNAFGGLIHPLISSKPLFEASQTGFLIKRTIQEGW
jgi:E3 ubiquitin-protein ligase HUWE1